MRFTGFLFLSAVAAVGSSAAETFRYGGSTAIIEQSGSGGASKSEATRYNGGQRIVTQDGSSRDITIQGSGGSPPPIGSWERPDSSTERFDRPSIEERFSRLDPDERGFEGCSGCTASSAREAFKQRTLDRMHGGFTP